ncbi:PREDICTED: protein LURP-one-related 10 [Nelumbo nucifera]|uniref:Protein LURP-one-related 10-like n=2 Tax=Nelumbo nucifera TaxID=4432 RepID=A0A822Y1R0_NELNU|nr:PREDICTED: protein LURP-one-related 10 [Nelumbo nucifera]DAD26387.1 TPA_asm: hypothetical protein HUJ06_027855 [Nelumbo nucifera]
MAQPSFPPTGSSYPPLSNPVSVIGLQFCSPFLVDLTIVRKVMTITDGNFIVTDINGNIIFKVKGGLLSLRDRRVLVDAAGNPIVSLQQKILTAHKRWQVFRGESSDTEDLLFSAKKSSMLQFKTELDVFLATNTKEDVCDFKIKGSWLERSCDIYTGDSSTSTVIAQMHKKHSIQSMILGKDSFMVTVYPNIDHAFIIALIVILDEINQDKDD